MNNQIYVLVRSSSVYLYLTIKTTERRHWVLGFLTVKGTTLFRVHSKICVSQKAENSCKK